MYIIGLTGCIGAGKTTLTRLFSHKGIPCFDADARAHHLMAPGGRAVDPLLDYLGSSVPGLETCQGGINRSVLLEYLIHHPEVFSLLDSVLHPLIAEEKQRFLKYQARQRRSIVLLDIPLLLEAGWEDHCNMVILVTAPAFLRKQRVLSRSHMTLAGFQALQARQWSDARKSLGVDEIITTGSGLATTFRQLNHIMIRLAGRKRGKPLYLRPAKRFSGGQGGWMETR